MTHHRDVGDLVASRSPIERCVGLDESAVVLSFQHGEHFGVAVSRTVQKISGGPGASFVADASLDISELGLGLTALG